MSNRLLAIVFGLALALLLIALIPMRAALGWAGVNGLDLSAQAVRGSIWSGRLTQARAGSAPLGDLSAGIDPVALISGGVGIRVRGEAGALIQSAVLVRRGEAVGVTALSGALPLSLMGLPGLSSGQMAMEAVTVRFGSAGCEVAEGRVSTDALSDVLSGLEGPALSGDLSCASDGAAQAVLQGAAGGVDVRAVLALYPDGRVVLNSHVRSADPVAGLVLEAAGFQASGDGWVRTEQGRLSPAS